MRPRDTSPEAWEVLLELQRRMTPGEKLARVFEHSAFVRSEVFLRFARQTLGAELFVRVYGDESLSTAY